MVAPPNVSSSEETFESHEWKSQFARTKFGRNSPNIFAKFRKQFLTSPPVRNVKSPKLTEEELDALTGDLPYETNYTYAYSSLYNPSLPDHWQVPNLRGSSKAPVYMEEHNSAASISRKLFYFLRLPFVFFLHMILFILHSVTNGTKITVVGVWEYFIYCIRGVMSFFDRSRKSSASVYRLNYGERIRNYFSWIVSCIMYCLATPYRLFKLGSLDSAEMSAENDTYELRKTRSMNNQNSRSLRNNRSVNSPSLSPARTTRNSSNLAHNRNINSKVFDYDENEGSSSTLPISRPDRSVKNRSVTPVRQSVAMSLKKTTGFETFHREDTPLSFYGLRSRNVERNTPEPTFESRNFNRLSTMDETPKSRIRKDERMRDTSISSYSTFNFQKISYILTTIGKYILYAVLIPFFALRHIYYFVTDNVSSWFIASENSSMSGGAQRVRRAGAGAHGMNDGADVATIDDEEEDIQSVVMRKRIELTANEDILEQPSFIGLVGNIAKADIPITKKMLSIAELCVIDFVLIYINMYNFLIDRLASFDWRKLFVVLLLLALFIFFLWPLSRVSLKPEEGTIRENVHYWDSASCLMRNATSYANSIWERIALIPGIVSNLMYRASNVIISYNRSASNSISEFYYKLTGSTNNIKHYFVRFFYYKILIPFAAIGTTIAKWSERIVAYIFNEEYGLTVTNLKNVWNLIIKGLYYMISIPILKAIELYNLIPSAPVHTPIMNTDINIPPNEINIPPNEINIPPNEINIPPNEINILPATSQPKVIPVIMPDPQPQVIEIDQAKIIAEITDTLRTELSARFHSELTQEFEKNYREIIEKLKMQNTNIKVDKTNLEALVRQMIYEYDADKTGQVDYALESSGASVISTRCSETYNSYSRLEKIWNIPLWYSTYGPRTVIQRNSKTLFPGECWSFKNDRGYLTVDLSHHIEINSVSYEHIGKELAPGGNRQSAPKDFKIWAYKQVDDIKTRFLVGEYTYELDGPQLQFFIAQSKPNFPVKIIELEVTSNYGAVFTCLYRLRVHGKVYQF